MRQIIGYLYCALAFTCLPILAMEEQTEGQELQVPREMRLERGSESSPPNAITGEIGQGLTMNRSDVEFCTDQETCKCVNCGLSSGCICAANTLIVASYFVSGSIAPYLLIASGAALLFGAERGAYVMASSRNERTDCSSYLASFLCCFPVNRG